MKALSYKGYHASVEFDPEDRILVGRVIGIADIICFHGTSVSEIETAFRESVDGYLATCEDLGRPPARPYSGRLTLRLSPELHAAVVAAAQISQKSVNKWVVETLKTAAPTL